MIIKGKYKIARRLGAPIFEKTQTRRFTLSEAKRKEKGDFGKPRARSDFGMQLLEKQKVRYTYGVGERQFSKYAKSVLERRGVKQEEKLYEILESRLDNVVYRLGLARTHQAARQLVSHGHITVGGSRVTIPSFRISIGDVVGIRAGSLKKIPFMGLEERFKELSLPNWLTFDIAKKEGKVLALPTMDRAGMMFDLSPVLEFYKR